ncbi:MAG: hypothetical protein LBI39_00055, partial [Puniceicoccales bacterium]|nr:hypothetical protein [Puniceicoccales bacterium]
YVAEIAKEGSVARDAGLSFFRCARIRICVFFSSIIKSWLGIEPKDAIGSIDENLCANLSQGSSAKYVQVDDNETVSATLRCGAAVRNISAVGKDIATFANALFVGEGKDLRGGAKRCCELLLPLLWSAKTQTHKDIAKLREDNGAPPADEVRTAANKSSHILREIALHCLCNLDGGLRDQVLLRLCENDESFALLWEAASWDAGRAEVFVKMMEETSADCQRVLFSHVGADGSSARGYIDRSAIFDDSQRARLDALAGAAFRFAGNSDILDEDGDGGNEMTTTEVISFDESEDPQKWDDVPALSENDDENEGNDEDENDDEMHK